MKRYLVFFGIMLVIAGFSSCASSAAAKAETGSSVWKVSKNGQTLFLGGSIHILREQDFPLPEEFDRAFEESAALILEADVSQAVDESTAAAIAALMLLPEGQTLQSVLSAEVYGQLGEKCAEFGLVIETVSRFKPSLVINLLTVMQIQQFGFVEQGVDMYYLSKAREAGKELGFFETLEEQAVMLAGMGDGYEDDFVRYSLGEFDESESEITALAAEWRQGLPLATETALASMEDQWPVIYQELIIRRNAAWLPRIEAYLASEPVELVIVGLAHLHGDDGLLRQLKNSGYAVEQVR